MKVWSWLAVLSVLSLSGGIFRTLCVGGCFRVVAWNLKRVGRGLGFDTLLGFEESHSSWSSSGFGLFFVGLGLVDGLVPVPGFGVGVGLIGG